MSAVAQAKPASWKPDTFAGQSRMDLSRQWMARPRDQRYLTLDALHDRTKAMYMASENSIRNLRQSPKAIEVIAPEGLDDIHSLGIVLDEKSELAFSHHSFSQISGLAGAPGGYLRTLPAALVSDNLNWGLRMNRKIDGVALYHSEGQMRAATGPDYGRIPDYEVVAAVRNFTGSKGSWKIPGTLDWRTGIYNPRAEVTIDSTTLFGSDRDVFMFLVDDLNPIEIGKTKDGHPDYVFRGFYVYNSEVGVGSLKIAAFYLRAICCNRIMWGVEGFEEITIRHTKYAPDRFIEMARPALESYANGSVQKLKEGVEKAKATRVAKDDDSAFEFLKERKFTKDKIKKIMEAVENEEGRKLRTAWDAAQGITAVARSEGNNDVRVEMERTAGAILDKVAA